jgi:hypothetical protein
MKGISVFAKPEYSYLSESLQDLIDGFGSNVQISVHQREIWHRDGRSPAITHGMWGTDHAKRLVLLEKDGLDGKPVGSRGRSTARKFWSLDPDHTFPTAAELIRTALFFGIGFYDTVFLALKGEWEKHAAVVSKWKRNEGDRFGDVFAPECLQRATGCFNPDIECLYDLLEKQGGLSSSAGYDLGAFAAMANELLINDLHFRDIRSPELDAFAKQQCAHITNLRNGTPAQQDEFWLLRHSWQEHLRMLDDVLIAIEDLRVQIAEITRRWLCSFGDLEVPLTQAFMSCEELRERIRRKTADMTLSPTDLDELMRLRDESDEIELDDLRNRVALAPVLVKRFGDAESMSAEDLVEYTCARRSAARRLAKMTHNDTLEQHPAYQKLTAKQKEQLALALQMAIAAKGEDVGWDARDMRSGMRCLEGLLRAISEVEHHLEFAGIDMDYGLTIQGGTLKERIEWLRNEKVRVTAEISVAQGKLRKLRPVREGEYGEKEQILADPGRHPTVRRDIEAEVAKLNRERTELEDQLRDLFSGVAAR